MVNKKVNTSAKEAKTTKAIKRIITRKGATNRAEESSAATEEPKQGNMPVEEEKITTLILRTKNGMRDLDVLQGKLYQSSDHRHTFTQTGIDESEKHPWACFTTIVDVKPYARISANADGATLHIYVPEQNFESTEELADIFSEYCDKLLVGLSREDARGIIDKMKEMKQKMLKGLRWYRVRQQGRTDRAFCSRQAR